MRIKSLIASALILTLALPACFVVDATDSELSRPKGKDVKVELNQSINYFLFLGYSDLLGITSTTESSKQAGLTTTLAINALDIKSNRRYQKASVENCRQSMFARALLLPSVVLESYTITELLNEITDNLVLANLIVTECKLVEADPIYDF